MHLMWYQIDLNDLFVFHDNNWRWKEDKGRFTVASCKKLIDDKHVVRIQNLTLCIRNIPGKLTPSCEELFLKDYLLVVILIELVSILHLLFVPSVKPTLTRILTFLDCFVARDVCAIVNCWWNEVPTTHVPYLRPNEEHYGETIVELFPYFSYSLSLTHPSVWVSISMVTCYDCNKKKAKYGLPDRWKTVVLGRRCSDFIGIDDHSTGKATGERRLGHGGRLPNRRSKFTVATGEDDTVARRKNQFAGEDDTVAPETRRRRRHCSDTVATL
ncbi:hypothetical protein LXL04_038011 [Taraxacum kok-saghyz]